MEIWLLLFFILIILYVIKLNNAENRNQVVNILKQRGFNDISVNSGFLDFGNIIAHSNTYKLYIDTYDRGDNEASDMHFKIIVEALIQTDSSFKITKRGTFSKLLGINQGNLSSFDGDLNISTMNLPNTEELIAYPGVYTNLQILKPKLDYIVVSGRRITIQIGVKKDNQYLIYSINLIESILEKITKDNIKFNIQNYFIYEKYSCFSCNREIEFRGELCQFCGEPSPRCIVCYDDPEPNEKIVMLECCKAYGHTSHIDSWFLNQTKCPNCGFSKPGIVKVQENWQII
ncbi:MAG: hypothetical protein OEZ01_05070 [Candidatus Heimdallarchaeota archaeon]|nr:hypothetical protein [Candidatus Heimdallarchaeota archaeon]MDH5645354.1 hypothetical protein [Candidatus Heimdallarchaeota archaeon]